MTTREAKLKVEKDKHDLIVISKCDLEAALMKAIWSSTSDISLHLDLMRFIEESRKKYVDVVDERGVVL